MHIEKLSYRKHFTATSNHSSFFFSSSKLCSIISLYFHFCLYPSHAIILPSFLPLHYSYIVFSSLSLLPPPSCFSLHHPCILSLPLQSVLLLFTPITSSPLHASVTSSITPQSPFLSTQSLLLSLPYSLHNF